MRWRVYSILGGRRTPPDSVCCQYRPLALRKNSVQKQIGYLGEEAGVECGGFARVPSGVLGTRSTECNLRHSACRCGARRLLNGVGEDYPCLELLQKML
jgi:hypothetical protein